MSDIQKAKTSAVRVVFLVILGLALAALVALIIYQVFLAPKSNAPAPAQETTSEAAQTEEAEPAPEAVYDSKVQLWRDTQAVGWPEVDAETDPELATVSYYQSGGSSYGASKTYNTIQYAYSDINNDGALELLIAAPYEDSDTTSDIDWIAVYASDGTTVNCVSSLTEHAYPFMFSVYKNGQLSGAYRSAGEPTITVVSIVDGKGVVDGQYSLSDSPDLGEAYSYADFEWTDIADFVAPTEKVEESSSVQEEESAGSVFTTQAFSGLWTGGDGATDGTGATIEAPAFSFVVPDGWTVDSSSWKTSFSTSENPSGYPEEAAMNELTVTNTSTGAVLNLTIKIGYLSGGIVSDEAMTEVASSALGGTYKVGYGSKYWPLRLYDASQTGVAPLIGERPNAYAVSFAGEINPGDASYDEAVSILSSFKLA